MNGIQENQKLEFAPDVNLLTGIEKRCSKCRIVKPLNEFYPRRTAKVRDGRKSDCKECNKKAVKEWQCINFLRRRETRRQRHEKDIEGYRKKRQQQREKNKEKYRESNRQRMHQRRQENPERFREKDRQWVKKNPEKVRARSKRSSEKRRTTPQKKLNNGISNLIRLSLHGNKNGYHWETLTGYTVQQLKGHLEKRFLSGMTWENMGKYGWHLEHIIPVSAFNFKTVEDMDFKRCWALKNLRPMWAFDNLSKGAKLIKPFQPALIL